MPGRKFQLNKQILIFTTYKLNEISGGARNLRMILDGIDLTDSCFLLDKENRGAESCYVESNYRYVDLFSEQQFGTQGHVRPLRKLRSATHFFRHIWRTAKFGRLVIRKNRLDILVAVTRDTRVLMSAYLTSVLSRKPLVLYLFDLYFNKAPSGVKRIFYSYFEKKLLHRAALIIVTNEGTRQYYIDKYGDGLKIEVINNSILDERRQFTDVLTGKPPYKILFTGNIYWAQERSVVNLLRAVESIEDLDVQVNIYAPKVAGNEISKYRGHPKVRFDVASEEDISKIQSEADILFLPLAWYTKESEIIKTATPGKLTDYLNSGRPILVHAPEYAYLCEYAKERGFAHVVSEENTELLQKGIRRLLNDSSYANKLVEAARETFMENHTADRNRKKFVKYLNAI